MTKKNKRLQYIYLILNTADYPPTIVFASLSQIKRNEVYEEIQNCVDLECIDQQLNKIHEDYIDNEVN